ncbi:hypothetical protein ASG67_01845 [Sphingomonas sp. Leaf339]|uniref:glycosyltransferase family 39 protein n=1 Tax=Sphingomonas sp. Leaf339 TaxID=1736343 RepID=UPI0006FB15C9|nr:glycosyltransferase family 39 protein [Sphingomonas sp. Leaf339]KQU61928.1 hypothetical protein ASG67_01845 [Sphingomonas sp. Leaf339]
MTRTRTTPILLFLLVWLSAAWFGSWEFNPNNATRLFAAISLVEDGDAVIDEFAPMTIDKAEFDGHVYLDKAPGMTLMALPAVAVATWATGERSAGIDKTMIDPRMGPFLRLRLRLAAASGPALLTAIAAVLLYDLALGLTGSAAAALFAALGYALGTPIWGWSTTITGHAPVAALYVIAVWAFHRAATSGRSGLMLLGGLALGGAVVVEYQAVLAGSAIAIWASWSIRTHPNRARLLALAIAGGVVGLLPLLAYNLIAFGTPFRIAYAGVKGFEGMHQGLFGLTVPKVPVLFEVLFGDRRGLFWVAPVLLLAPLGLAALADVRRTRAIGLVAMAVVTIALLVNAAYVYWDGGNATGPRHAMPLAGLLSLGLATFWSELKHGWQRWAAATLLGVSMAINLIVAAAEIFAPPEYRFPLWSAVFDLRFRRGDIRTWPSEWLGWTTWHGFELYLTCALPLLALLVWRIRRGFS